MTPPPIPIPLGFFAGGVASPFVNDRSLLLDGVDEYASRAGAAVTGCEFDWNDPFTVNAWVRTSTAGVGIAASKVDPGPSQRGWTFGILSGRPFFGLNSNIGGLGTYMQAYVDQVVATGAWKMLTAVYDGSGVVAGVSFFVNGTDLYPSGQTTQAYVDLLGGGTTLGGAAAPLAIGSQSGTAFFLDGDLDEVSIWSAALTPAEVAALMAPDGSPANLVGLANLDSWYRCGEAAGDSAIGDIHDVSGNGNDVACANMEIADITTDTAAYFWNNLSLNLDGVDEQLSVSNAIATGLDFAVTDSWSVSAWVKTTAHSGLTAGYVASKIGTAPTYRGWAVGVYQGWPIWFLSENVGGGTYTQAYTTQAITDGLWHHVAWVYDAAAGVGAAGLAIYVDGVVGATQIYFNNLNGASITVAPVDFLVGSTNYLAYYEGKIDELAVVARALTAADVTSIFNGGSPDDLGSVPDLRAWYRLGDATFDAVVAGQPTVCDESLSGNDLMQANIEQIDFNPDIP